MQTHSLKRHQSFTGHQPFINKLGKDSRRPPEVILNFYSYVTTTENSDHSGASDFSNLLLLSFSKDLFFEVFNFKYTSIVKELHSLTRRNLHCEGHCISGDMISRIKTSQNGVAEGCIKSSQTLPI